MVEIGIKKIYIFHFRPYDPQWFEDEIDEDEVLDDEGRARLKLKVIMFYCY